MGALIEQAKLWGGMKHKGQTRKYTGEAYFTHCEAVAELVERHYMEFDPIGEAAREDIVAAALLHDVVEDTTATLEEVEDIFGKTVATYVWYLTKPPGLAGSRATRKALYNAQLNLAPKEVKVIKFYDTFHNHGSIEEHDPGFFETWMPETQRLMAAMEIQNVMGPTIDRYFTTYGIKCGITGI